eukprot:1432395-Pyramimonas_sp.AAC.1
MVCEDAMSDFPRDAHRLEALRAICRIYRCFQTNGMFLPEHVHLEAMNCLQTFYNHYAWLLHNAVANNRL